MTVSRSKRLLFWFAKWTALSVFWFIFVGKVDFMEALVGISATALVAAATEKLRGQNFARFHPRKRWLLGAWRLPVDVLRDSAIVTAVLLRRVLRRRLQVICQ